MFYIVVLWKVWSRLSRQHLEAYGCPTCWNRVSPVYKVCVYTYMIHNIHVYIHIYIYIYTHIWISKVAAWVVLARAPSRARAGSSKECILNVCLLVGGEGPAAHYCRRLDRGALSTGWRRGRTPSAPSGEEEPLLRGRRNRVGILIELSGLQKAYRRPQFTGTRMKNRGVPFHRIREVLAQQCSANFSTTEQAITE